MRGRFCNGQSSVVGRTEVVGDGVVSDTGRWADVWSDLDANLFWEWITTEHYGRHSLETDKLCFNLGLVIINNISPIHW